MTTPTPAQIEAATKAMCEMWVNSPPVMFEDLAAAALTAAAEVAPQAFIEAKKERDAGWPELAAEVAAKITDQDREYFHALYGTIPDEAIASALTAAAEVGEQSCVQCPNCGKPFECFHCGYRYGLSAAAEVCPQCGRPADNNGAFQCRCAGTAAAGVRMSMDKLIMTRDTFAEQIRRNNAAIIERCAQVVERYAVNIGDMAATIAAELRALKDKP